MTEVLTDEKIECLQLAAEAECRMNTSPQRGCRMGPCARCFFRTRADPEELAGKLHLRIRTVKGWLEFFRSKRGGA